jgi:CubicO group peptidase (beta-lactamase class C family)
MYRLMVTAAVLSGWSAVAGAAPQIDPAALDHLVARARATHSNALLVWQHGKLIREDYFGTRPHGEPLMSTTKSIVALAIGKLVDDGKLRSFDQPVSDFYPEWKQGRKQSITIRHLLTHTSGLQNEANTVIEIYPAPDAIKLALAAELSDPPGTKFSYNNKATNLLAGIVQRASGQRMDRYVAGHIFRPLGIVDARWVELDRAGTPYAMSGLVMTAADLLKIGQLVLGNGSFAGKRVLSERTMQAIVDQGDPSYPGYGLLWWRLARSHVRVVDDDQLAMMRRAGVDPQVIAALATLKGHPMASDEEREAGLKQALGDDWIAKYKAGHAKTDLLKDQWSADFIGFNTNGYLGEYLIVLPAAELIAVRLVDIHDTHDDDDDFSDFLTAVRRLVEPAAPGPTN